MSSSVDEPRRLLLLTDGYSGTLSAKTANSVLRYCTDQVVAVLDTEKAGMACESVFGIGGEIPIVDHVSKAPEANTLLVGIAPSGGKLPGRMKAQVIEAIEQGMHVESGLHQFLNHDPDISSAAKTKGVRLVDVRMNDERDVSSRQGIRENCLRIHAVGNDCSLGKMVTTIETSLALKKAGHDAKFVATGQTGILIEGDGCPIDCVVADFVNGAAEKLVLENQHHDILLIEGQGSLAHPRFSAVTLGLLHGIMPHGLIYCYEAGRETVKEMDHMHIPDHDAVMELCLKAANIMHPCEFIGININSRLLNDEAYRKEKALMEDRYQLPVTDVYRESAEPFCDAILALRERVLG